MHFLKTRSNMSEFGAPSDRSVVLPVRMTLIEGCRSRYRTRASSFLYDCSADQSLVNVSLLEVSLRFAVRSSRFTGENIHGASVGTVCFVFRLHRLLVRNLRICRRIRVVQMRTCTVI